VYLLDSDVLIDVQRGHPPAVSWFAGLAEAPSIPGIVKMELIQAARNAAEIQRALRQVAHLPVVWPGEADCARALADLAALRLSSGLGLLDALIAATAVGQGATLCTFNAKHYQHVPGLSWQRPYAR
jgi:predicted nucleic acid-binding protein